MNNSTQKSIKRLSIAILIIGGITLIYTYVQMISQLWLNNFIIPITWNPDIKGWQIFILAARFVGITLIVALCCVFLYRINKGLKDGEIFPKSNISIVRWSALVAAGVYARFQHYSYSSHRPSLRGTLQNGLSGSKRQQTRDMITVNLDKMLWERHMKLSELSERIGISMTNLSLLKTGKGRAIRFTTLNKLCKVLECVPGDILNYKPDPEGIEMEEDIYED